MLYFIGGHCYHQFNECVAECKDARWEYPRRMERLNQKQQAMPESNPQGEIKNAGSNPAVLNFLILVTMQSKQ